MSKFTKRFTITLLCFALAVVLFPWGDLADAISAAKGEVAEQVQGYYEIWDEYQLFWFAEQVNSGNGKINGRLMADITVNAAVLDPDQALLNDGSGLTGWTPIGTSCKTAFKGIFDGNGHTVSGLYCSSANGTELGLIGYNAGTVRNVGILDSYFCGLTGIGSVVGTNVGTVSDCYSAASTNSITGGDSSSCSCSTSDSNVGGVVGSNSGTVTECSNTGPVRGYSDRVGGVVGHNTGTVDNCANTGKVRGLFKYVGGIVGCNSGDVWSCNNSGRISGGPLSYYVGGAVGFNSATVDHCENSGIVSGGCYVGGVVGQNYQGKVTYCTNTVKVSGTSYTGGITGSSSGFLSGSSSTGRVFGTDNAGGITGNNYGIITDCFNKGSISATTCVGGLVGFNDGRITDGFNTGSVEGTKHIGSVIGKNTGTVTDTFYLAKTVYGGIDGDDQTGAAEERTAEEFRSGAVAYIFNGGITDGTQMWYQTVGKTYPSFSGKTVYLVGSCTGEEPRYSNEPGTPAHGFNDPAANGICSCGTYQAADWNEAEQVYEIGNAGQLYWFAAQVNSGNRDIHGKLTANITVNEGKIGAGSAPMRSWIPMGGPGLPYAGSFDGDGHWIRGLYCNGKSNYVGLFGYIGKTGSVKDVALTDIYFCGNNYVGGIAGCGNDITGCSTSGTVKGTYYVGGIVGDHRGEGSVIRHCYNTGTVTGTGDYVGGLIGYNAGAVSDSFNMGTVTGGSNYVGSICGSNFKGTASNCYYLTGCAKNAAGYTQRGMGSQSRDFLRDVAGSTKGVSRSRFTSGELAYLLGTPFGQNIDNCGATLDHPVLSDATIYLVKDCAGNDTYSNSGTDGVHRYNDTTGTCTLCGASCAHRYETVETAPDCTTQGHTSHYCGICGYGYADHFVDALGHSFGDDDTCDRCGHRSTITIQLEDRTGDGWNGNAIAVYADNVLVDTVTLLAGSKASWSIPRDLHARYTFRWVNAPTAEECSFQIWLDDAALLRATTENCGAYADGQFLLTVKGSCRHTYMITVTAPTCTADGYTTYICDLCGDSFTDDVEEATGHDYTAVVTPPSCTEGGFTTYVCSGCHDHYTAAPTDPLGHRWSKGTCTGCGLTPPAVQIKKQPTSVKVASGSNARVTVNAFGDGLVFQWFFADKGSNTFVKTNTFRGSSYNVVMNAARNGRRVYCVISDKYGNSVRTDTVTLSMRTPLKITKQPVSVKVASGSGTKITVKAQGDGLTYQWYFAEKGSNTFTKTNAFRGNGYNVIMNAARNGRRVYCVITDAYGNSVKTDTVTLTMRTPLKITKQPVSVKVASGSGTKVTVKAQGDGLTYQWYFAEKGSNTFTKTNAFRGNGYNVVMNAARNGRRVYCVITDAYGNSVRTNTVTLTMRTPLKITKQPVSVKVTNGSNAKVTVKVQGDGLTYKWYFAEKGASTFTKTNAFKGSSYNVVMNAARNGRRVYCVITDAYGNSVRSKTVTLTMRIPLKITQHPTSVKVAGGANAKVTVKAQGEGLTYTWYFAEKGSNTFIKTNAFKGSSYNVVMNAARNGRRVYCVITDAYGYTVRSVTVTLNMRTPLKITQQPASVKAAGGDNAKVTVKAQGDGLTYTWYFAEKGSSTFTKTNAFKGSSYNVVMNAARDGRRVYCVITDRYGNKVRTDTVTLSMK